MNGKKIMQVLLMFACAVALQGCMALQLAEFSQPHAQKTQARSFEYADGAGIKLPTVCLVVREGMGSADYRYQFIGPLIFTIFPFELFDHEAAPDFYELEFDFVPDLDNSILFDLGKTTLFLDDGSTVQPYAYQVWHGFSAPPPFLNVKDLKESIVLKTAVTHIRLRYRKPGDGVGMARVFINGLHSLYEPVESSHEITFEPKKIHVRYVFPGMSRNNVFPWPTLKDRCK